MRDVYREMVKREARCVPVKLIQQPASQMCWAACYRMIVEWRNPAQQQSWCYYSALRKTSCAQSACSEPGQACNQPREITSILGDWLKLGFKSTTEHLRPLSWSEVLKSIEISSPVQVFLDYRDGSVGHYFLIIGTSYLRNSNTRAWLIANPLEKSLYQIDVTQLGQLADWRCTWTVS